MAYALADTSSSTGNGMSLVCYDTTYGFHSLNFASARRHQPADQRHANVLITSSMATVASSGTVHQLADAQRRRPDHQPGQPCRS